MPPRAWQERVEDILEAMATICVYTAGLTEDEFIASRMLTEAVQYNFVIIGEAVANIPEELRDRHPEIPWRKMRDMRNFMTHVYFGVNLHIVWLTARQDLDTTAAALRELLAQEAGTDGL